MNFSNQSEADFAVDSNELTQTACRDSFAIVASLSLELDAPTGARHPTPRQKRERNWPSFLYPQSADFVPPSVPPTTIGFGQISSD